MGRPREAFAVSRLFNPVARVTVIRQPTGFVAKNPSFFESTGNAIEITDLRIQFKVTKNLGKHPNKAIIGVSQLSSTTRAEIERKPLRVMLHAGYDGVARLLFVGDLKRAYSKRAGPTEIVTEMHVADGIRAFAHARMNRSYKPPTSIHRVLSDAAQSMGLQLPPDIDQAKELRQPMPSGLSANGATRDVLTRALAPLGYGWSIQNGQLTILRDEGVRAGEAFLVNQSTGLVESPEATEPERPKQRSEVKFKTLLYPELNPGSAVKLESEFLNLQLKITDVSHEGDTQGTSWTTDVQGRPVK